MMKKKLYLTAVVFSFLLMSCGGGRPVILSPADGQVIPLSSGFGQGFGTPVITVQIENDDPDVQITFQPATVPGLQCIPGQARAYCYANQQGGSVFQDTPLVIRAQNGDNVTVHVVTLRPGGTAAVDFE